MTLQLDWQVTKDGAHIAEANGVHLSITRLDQEREMYRLEVDGKFNGNISNLQRAKEGAEDVALNASK